MTISTAGSSSRIRVAAHAPSRPGGMRMSRNTTANGSLRARLSLTAVTAASALSQNTGSKPAARAGERSRAVSAGSLRNSRLRSSRKPTISWVTSFSRRIWRYASRTSASSSTTSTRIGVEFGSAIMTSGSPGERGGFTGTQRYEQMHRGPMTGPIAGRPDAAAERADRVGAPVQADAMVGFRGLGGEAFFEDACEVLRGNADAIVPALQVQLLHVVLAHDFGAEAQYAALLAGIAHGVGGVDDEILQDQPQHRARHAHRPDTLERLVSVDPQALPAGVRHDFQRLRHQF